MEEKVKEAKVLLLSIIRDPEYHATFLKSVPQGFNVLWKDLNELTEDEIVNHVCDTNFLLTSGTEISEQALRRALPEAKQLKLIQVTTTGYDNIPLTVTTELGIPVANIGTANSIPVGEHTVLLMLAVLRRLCPNVIALRQGKAKYFQLKDQKLYRRLYGKMVGIIGFGNIGRHVAGIVRGFGAQVIWYDPYELPPDVIKESGAGQVDLNELLRTADIVSLHVPSTANTQNMIGWEQLQLMKPSSIVINTSRGEIIDEKALIKALREEEIFGAGLDVFVKEPPEPDNPLLDMENVVATPHLGANAYENIQARQEVIWGNIVDVWQGKPPRGVIKLQE